MATFNLRAFSLILGLTFVYDTHQTANDANVQVLYQWSFVDFLYPSQQARLVATTQRLYQPQNVVILDSDYYFSPRTSTKRIFVTTPQFRSGIPATVSEISKETNANGEYLLKPFPNWDSLGTISCDFAVSVYRIHIDKCGLLWVLDTGRVDGFGNPRRACRPKLLIYDLSDGDTLIESYEFPDGTINDRSNLITLVTESYQENCRDSVAYIADVNAYGLVVFDLANRNSWRVEHKFFYPFPNFSTLTVAGVTFDLLDGIFGLTLGPGNAQNRKLYFHSLASVREVWVPTSVLKNTSIVQNSDLLRNQFMLSEEARDGQSTLEVMTDDGILIFSSLPHNAIVCWNSALPFAKRNLHIVYQNPDTLQFISGMKLKRSKTLLITSSRLQNYIVGNLNYTDVKYRVIIIDDVNELLKGTPCKGAGTDWTKPTSAQKPSAGPRPLSSTSVRFGSSSSSSSSSSAPKPNVDSSSQNNRPPLWQSSS